MSPANPHAALAESYVRLALAVGRHDPDYVDSYHGPAAWRRQVDEEALPLSEIERRVRRLQESLAELEAENLEDEYTTEDEMRRLRHRYLQAHLRAMETRSRMLQGHVLPFDEESWALYGAVARRYEDDEFVAVLERLDRRLREEGFSGGLLAERLASFRQRFTVPPDRVDAVFRTALAAARERTLEYMDLPPDERFRVEYVEDPPWSAYNWYQGHYESLIQVNVRFPVRVLPLLALACHEGYPGHHVHHTSMDHHMVHGRGWIEHSVQVLFAPQALTAEGVATQEHDLAFPDRECLSLLREELFPRAGLDPHQAEVYLELSDIQKDLAPSGTEAARRLLDGELDDRSCADWLARHTTLDPKRAARSVSFYRRYGAYVVTYFRGRELLRAHLDRSSSRRERWQRFRRVVTTPVLLADLRPDSLPT